VDRRDNRLPDAPNLLTIYSDLHCSFAHLALHRLHETRRALGLDGRVWLDHRSFPLELFNERVNSLRGVNSETSVVGALDPTAGWKLWQAHDWEYPVTTLPGMEAVAAAKRQSWAASEELDRGLRQAFWRDSQCISMRHVIRRVAGNCPSVDLAQLTDDLDSGEYRSAPFEHFAQARDGRVNCSPHVFLHDGTNMPNPGVTVRWINGRFGVGFPIVDAYDTSVYEELLTHAAMLAGIPVTAE
jgi:predicted DsbA family dithiol-disulfide isomerase